MFQTKGFLAQDRLKIGEFAIMKQKKWYSFLDNMHIIKK